MMKATLLCFDVLCCDGGLSCSALDAQDFVGGGRLYLGGRAAAASARVPGGGPLKIALLADCRVKIGDRWQPPPRGVGEPQVIPAFVNTWLRGSALAGIEETLDAVFEALANGKAVLAHCDWGRHRSPCSNASHDSFDGIIAAPILLDPPATGHERNRRYTSSRLASYPTRVAQGSRGGQRMNSACSSGDWRGNCFFCCAGSSG